MTIAGNAVPGGLAVDALRVRFGGSEAVSGVSAYVGPGEVLGLVGESGSGKTTVCRAIAGILPAHAYVEGSVRINGRASPLTRRRDASLERPRIGFVFQSPEAALNPCVRVGVQLTEHLQRAGVSERARLERAEAMLDRMRMGDVERIMRRYPHELSGGQQQRVCIGIALLNDPEILIFDEPTTALDVTTQAAILDLLREILSGSVTPAIYVSHDLRVVNEIADHVAVMSEGRIVELGPTRRLLADPSHPYTRTLIASQPDLHIGALGVPPPRVAASAPAAGCRYAGRCPIAEPGCLETEVNLVEIAPEHSVRCLRVEAARGISLRRAPESRRNRQSPGSGESLQVDGLTVYLGSRHRRQKILAEVTLELTPGRTLAIVGETGAGKTTLARALLGLMRPDSGEIRLGGRRLPSRIARRRRDDISTLQMVFQSARSSLNPRQTVRSILTRALRRLGHVERANVEERLLELVEEVRLLPGLLARRPDRLSGGERQRVAIARALAAKPEIIVLDEAVSALDVSAQAAILQLLRRVQDDDGLAYLFISHDLAVVAGFADEIAVLYGGQVVESGPVESVLGTQHHPYTEVLFRSVPGGSPLERDALRALDGRLDRDARGCIFATRCPWKIGEICDDIKPPTRELSASHRVRCHYDASALAEVIGRDRRKADEASRELIATLGD
jgi:peptide/nickel transport system ATP-binding protein